MELILSQGANDYDPSVARKVWRILMVNCLQFVAAIHSYPIHHGVPSGSRVQMEGGFVNNTLMSMNLRAYGHMYTSIIYLHT